MDTLFEALGLTEQKGKLSAEQTAKVKALGCLRDKRYDDVFNVRVLTGNGKIDAEKARALSEAAERFGSGELAFTSRMTVELQGVPYQKIPALIFYLKEKGMETGGTGPKVRPVVSCKGTTCVFGRIDTYRLSERIHKEFYQGWHHVVLPHKFKIAVGGCPNNCVKPDLNDLGIVGQSVFSVDTDACRGCKKCAVEAACPMGAAALNEGKIAVDKEKCNRCGRCQKACPFGAIKEKSEGYQLFVGGRWGKKRAMGKPLLVLFTSEDEVMAAVERALRLFCDEGVKGERFADTLERLGWSYAEKKILGE